MHKTSNKYFLFYDFQKNVRKGYILIEHSEFSINYRKKMLRAKLREIESTIF